MEQARRSAILRAMFRSILVGYDGSRHARDALALARVLAAPDSELTLCCVHPFQPVAAATVTAAEAAGAATRSIAVAAASAASGLHAVAEDEGSDLLVVGSTQRSAAGRLLLGSTTTQALNAPPCAVAVATAGLAEVPPRLRRITAGFDGGREAVAALHAAADLARGHGAQLRVLTVVEPATQALGWTGASVDPGYRDDALAGARERLDEALEELPAEVAVETEVLDGVAARMLVAASADTDLLVLGSRGYGPVRRVLLGGVSSRVAGATACPALILPRTAALAAC